MSSASSAVWRYRWLAPLYDGFIWCGTLGRMEHLRARAVERLNVRAGALVVDLCCGTGLDFPYLQAAVGRTGTIIGVDVSRAMLERAAARVRRAGWRNVMLVQADVGRLPLRQAADAVLMTAAAAVVPNFPRVVREARAHLSPAGRLVVGDLDFMQGSGILVHLLNGMIGLGHRLAHHDVRRRPWTEVAAADREEFYRGFLYLLVFNVAPSQAVPKVPA